MILLILSRRLSFISESWAVEEEGIQCFDIKTANTNRIKCVSKNLCLNLCSLKWLRVAWRQVRKIVYFGWLMLKTLLLRGLIKFQIFFLKVEYEGELRILESNLFHSTNADGKKKSKKLFLTLHWEITKFWLLPVWYELLFEGIKSHKYFGNCSLTILQKTQSFWNHCLIWRDSSPSSWTFDEPLIAPTIANDALYWKDSSLCWKELL